MTVCWVLLSSARKSLNLRVALEIPYPTPSLFKLDSILNTCLFSLYIFSLDNYSASIVSAITLILPPSMLNLKLITTALGYFYLKYIGTSNSTGSKINSL